MEPVSAFAVYSKQKPKGSAVKQPKTLSNINKNKSKNKAKLHKKPTVKLQAVNVKSQAVNVKSQAVNVKSKALNIKSQAVPVKSQVVNVKPQKIKVDQVQHENKKSKKIKLDPKEVNKIEFNSLKNNEDLVRKVPRIKKLRDISNKSVLQNGTEIVKKDKQSKLIRIDISGPNSVENGRQLFSWLIHPIDVDEFFKRNWEQHPICVKRNVSYFTHLISSEEIDNVLRKKKLFFTKNIDVTSYSFEEGKRETHNPSGRANAPLVWDYYGNGCSIRLLNPQNYFPKIHTMNALLQEFFGCLVGANVYLTPAGTQGFAPHYDDIEAFVLQVEGQKLWKLYPPRTPSETLPRFSSGNFNEADLGPPLDEVLLSPGDMLYFPRGIIHQGKALEHTHSLHITLSMYQRNSWADLLEHLIPAALNAAVLEDVSFREGLPMGYLSHMGVVHCDTPSAHRTNFVNKLQELISRLGQYVPVDAACDQMGKKFMFDALPPHFKQSELKRMVYGDGEKIQSGKVYNQAELGMDTRVKLVRYNCLRMVAEDDTIRIYYSTDNSCEYHAEEPQFLEIDEDLAPAIDALISNYPDYLTVEEFPIQNDIAKVQIASDLWEHGLLITEEPLGYDSE